MLHIIWYGIGSTAVNEKFSLIWHAITNGYVNNQTRFIITIRCSGYLEITLRHTRRARDKHLLMHAYFCNNFCLNHSIYSSCYRILWHQRNLRRDKNGFTDRKIFVRRLAKIGLKNCKTTNVSVFNKILRYRNIVILVRGAVEIYK